MSDLPGLPVVPEGADDATRQDLLVSVLSTLCGREIADPTDYRDYAKFFSDLYSDESFRHRYSGIYQAIVDDPSSESVPPIVERCTCLSENLHQIWTVWVLGIGGSSEVLSALPHEKKQFSKLLDHVDLEARRLAIETSILVRQQMIAEEIIIHAKNISENAAETERSAAEVEKSADEVKKSAAEAKKSAAEAKESAAKAESTAEDALERSKSLQKETIAILGVFAAIVLAFNGAVGFSASSIEAVAMQPSMRNITLIVLLVGFVLFNALAILMTFVWMIVRVKPPVDHEQPQPRKFWERKMRVSTKLVIAVVVLDVIMIAAAVSVVLRFAPLF